MECPAKVTSVKRAGQARYSSQTTPLEAGGSRQLASQVDRSRFRMPSVAIAALARYVPDRRGELALDATDPLQMAVR